MCRVLSKFAGVLVLSLLLAVPALAQPARPAGPGGGAGAAPGGGPGEPLVRFMQSNVLTECILTLGDLNLSPEFTLTAEQKTKIKEIRDTFRKELEDARKLSADERGKLNGEMRTAFRDGNRDKVRALRTKLEALAADEPKAEEAVKKIKAVLTAEQLTKFEAAAKQREAARQAQMEEMRERFQRGGAAGGPAGDRGRRGAGGEGGAGGNGGARPAPPID